jgi:hypothetical protein
MSNTDMKNKFVGLILVAIFPLRMHNCSNDGTNSMESTKSCLVGYDWVHPNASNPTGAWKFSSDGTFNSRNIFFGAMSVRENRTLSEPCEIRISYTRSTEGIIPDDQILILVNCGSLKVD